MIRDRQKPRLLVATGNPGKAQEIRALLTGLEVEILTLADLEGLWRTETLGGLPASQDDQEISERFERLERAMAETADTFAGNAAIKARGARNITGLPALADDSGLVVDALGGAPGVYSARYAGGHGDDEANNRLLLTNLEGVPEERRTARFVAALVLALPDGGEFTAEGACEGRIGWAPKGEGGFGYDPLFILAGDGRTTAELPREEKNRISHRGKALQAMAPALRRIFAKKA